MKKLFLLLTIGSIALSAQAQQNTSIIFASPFNNAGGAQALTQAQMEKTRELSPIGHQNPGARTTSTLTDWYDMFDQNSTTSSLLFYNEIFPDTSVRDLSIVSSSFNGYIKTHGMGYSFDPTDSGYYSTALSVNGGQNQIQVANILPPTNQAFPLANPKYNIDSFFVLASYVRNDASVTADSLIIELVVAANWAADTGSYNLQTTTATTSYYADCYDERPRFGTLHYNAGHGGFPLYSSAIYRNDCYFDSIYAPKERFAFALTAANAGDTTTNGFLNLGHMTANTLVNNTPGTYSGGAVGQLNLPLPAPITIDPTTGYNPHLVTFVSFKSGHTGGTYTVGTSTTAANYMKLFTGVPSGSTTTWWQQSSGNSSIGYQGSFNVGVQAWGPQAYDDAFYTFNGHDVLISAYDFTGPGNEIPLEGFHINWTPTPATGIRNVNTLDNIAVYPNPANNSLNITFSAAQNSVATVSLMNMVGQIVATQNVSTGRALFNTSEIPSGMYIYAVEANGTRSTGHVAITH